jgi:hypothetical protein
VIRPAVARRDDPERLIRLADVLIAEPDGRPLEVQVSELFAEFGGLTLILIAGSGREVGIGARDGAIATLLLDSRRSVRLAAVVVYQGWVVAKSARPG